MSLWLRQSYDEEFCKLYDSLVDKYPEDLFLLEGIHADQLDINESARNFFRTSERKGSATADHSIDPNANVSGRDVITFNYEVPKPIMKLNSLYNLWLEIKNTNGLAMANSAIEGEISGAYYINDCWDIGRPYCFNYSTYDIAVKGLPMAGRLNINPPKGLSSFLHQVEQFTVMAANSTLGATGLADLLLVSACYVDKIFDNWGMDHKIRAASRDPLGGVVEREVWTYCKELMAHLVYTLNFEFRGNQSPFTNISIYDDVFLDQLIPSYELEGNTPRKETVKKLQSLFLEVMNEELSRNPITFPVVTACFSTMQEDSHGSRTIADKAFLDFIAKANQEKGFINIYCGEVSTLSSCCRLRSKVSDLGYSNTFGSGSTKIGSLGVVTLNLPRLAMLALDEEDPDEDFLANVKASTVMCTMINNAKRNFIKDRIARGALPLYNLGFMDIDRQYSTTGFTGLYEAVTILDHDMAKEDGVSFAQKVLDAINNANDRMSAVYKAPHNMEQVPAESSAVKLAKKDLIMNIWDTFDESEVPAMYSNQFTPLWIDDINLLERIDIQGKLDSYCTGGAIAHLNVDERIADWTNIRDLIEYACKKGVVYFAINYVINKCQNNHMSVGANVDTCPICNEKITDTFTRVVGFLTNTKHWNKARREKDFPNRVFY